MIRLWTALAAAAGLAFAASAAQASPCRGEAPEVGASLRGPVLHVEDGERLCVARGFDQTQWIELRLEDTPADSARGTLMAAAFAQDVDCRITAIGPDGPMAACTLRNRPLGRLLRKPSILKAGLAWR
ncbi:MAG: hypothetical protein ACK41C_13000 [Phenylobacterium sp.]|jgi:hypothetical protein|uniref:hypothetical protein n=1 Tax=Phenylobacterium sp. TaxID=1871053 RepID=UPI003918DB5F